MIATRLYSSIVIFLLIFLFSCKFSPDDIPETEVPPLSGNDTIILFNFQPDRDTIKVYKSATLQYNINTLEKKLYKVEFYLNNELLDIQEDFNTIPYNFEINTTGFNNGIYNLRILIYTGSNGQSIADKVGAMGLLFEVKWPLRIDKTEPRALKFISIDTVKNGVRISWEKFKHLSFQSYKLIKFSAPLELNKTLIIVNDPDINSFTDTEYLPGMKITYELRLNDSWPVKMDYSEIPPKPSVTFVNNFEVAVSWKAPRNISFLDYYYVHLHQTVVSLDQAKKIHDPAVRTQRNNVTFGLPQYFGVLYVPKYTSDACTGNLIRGETEFNLGDKMPLHTYVFPVPNTQIVILTKNGKLYRYNLSTGIITDSLQFNCEVPDYISVSNNGSFFGYSENGDFIIRSTQDLSFISSITSEDYAGLSSILYMFSLSNTKHLATVLEINILSVFDLATGNKIAEKKFENLTWMFARISPDGNYIITEQYDSGLHIIYYKVIGNQIVEVGRISDSELYFMANIDNPFGPDQEIYIIFEGKVEVRNITDFSVKRVIPLSYIRLIDYQNMNAVGSNTDFPGSDLAYLYDLRTETVIKNLFVRYPGTMKLHGNFLISEGGYKLNLNNIH
jgi:hypothetical protein